MVSNFIDQYGIIVIIKQDYSGENIFNQRDVLAVGVCAVR